MNIKRHLQALQKLGYQFFFEVITQKKVIIWKNGNKHTLVRNRLTLANWIDKIDEVAKQR